MGPGCRGCLGIVRAAVIDIFALAGFFFADLGFLLSLIAAFTRLRICGKFGSEEENRKPRT